MLKLDADVRAKLLSEGFDDEELDMLTTSQVALTELIKNAVEIDGVCFYTMAFGKHILIDMKNGVIYRFPIDKYDMMPSFSMAHVLFRPVGTDEWYLLYKDKLLYCEGLTYANGFSYKGSGKAGNYYYKSVQFRYKHYNETKVVNIKIHQIVSAMMYEWDILHATGLERVSDIHHKREVRLGGTNGHDNLILLDTLSHLKAHNKCVV
jgi:hypothetical protein